MRKCERVRVSRRNSVFSFLFPPSNHCIKPRTSGKEDGWHQSGLSPVVPGRDDVVLPLRPGVTPTTESCLAFDYSTKWKVGPLLSSSRVTGNFPVRDTKIFFIRTCLEVDRPGRLCPPFKRGSTRPSRTKSTRARNDPRVDRRRPVLCRKNRCRYLLSGLLLRNSLNPIFLLKFYPKSPGMPPAVP
jgi:hypothetical protein